MIGIHFGTALFFLVYPVLILGGGFVFGYGFRKGWDRAERRTRAAPREAS